MNNTGAKTAILHEMIFRVFFLEMLKMGFSGTSTGALRKNIVNTIPVESQNINLLKTKASKKYFAINAIVINMENETIRHL